MLSRKYHPLNTFPLRLEESRCSMFHVEEVDYSSRNCSNVWNLWVKSILPTEINTEQ